MPVFIFASTAMVQMVILLNNILNSLQKPLYSISSERRISRVNAALAAPAETKHDWQIAALFAQKLALLLSKTKPDFAYETPEKIWNEHRDSTRGRDLDITGLSYALLEEQGPQQWQIDLANQEILLGNNGAVGFSIDPDVKQRLLSGLDFIGASETLNPQIAEFEQNRRQQLPWLG